MAVAEHISLLMSKSENGDNKILYPVTTVDAVDGLDEAMTELKPTIKAAAGSNINTVGTPSVTASTSAATTTFTFNNLKGATGAQGPKGDTGATGAQGPKGDTGERGTGILKVTTAPSSYTTPIGEVTPNYRMALSTVKTQSGVSKVIVGDILQYSYRHYSVLYIDDTYVYIGAYTSIRGATGAQGPQGEQGIQGIQGEVGPQGPKGDTGATGADGAPYIPPVLTALPSSGTALAADTFYKVSTTVGTYVFEPPANGGWAHGKFTTASTVNMSFASGSTFINGAPNIEASKTYEFDVLDSVWVITEVVSQ